MKKGLESVLVTCSLYLAALVILGGAAGSSMCSGVTLNPSTNAGAATVLSGKLAGMIGATSSPQPK